MNTQKILISVAWPYVNGDIHVGHLAGYLLPADIVARYFRLKGDDVLMVSGSDCYGTPITVAADKLGLAPIEVVNKYHPKDVDLFNKYELSYNLYTQTTTDNHKEVVQQLFLDLLKNGYISKGTMQQYYSPQDNQFLPDRYVEGTCPHCNAKEQRSDQCESCGRWLSDGELISPTSKRTGAPVILKETEHYFLEFEILQDQLREYLDTKKNIWRNWVWKEADGWLREGLKNRAITRDLDWGIDLPVDEISKLDQSKQLTSYESKKIYVWLEAVIGYLSATVEWSKRVKGEIQNEDTIIFNKFDNQDEDWQSRWVNSDAKHYYFMGQDNLVFHTLMLPAQLMGAKRSYTLPHNVIVNKFMNYEGKKFSKSRNWTIDSKEFAEKYGVDLVRYYISANLPENKEANFTWESFVDSIHNELVANFGNFVNRSLVFLQNKFQGNLELEEIIYKQHRESNNTFDQIAQLIIEYKDNIEEGNIVNALANVMNISTIGNKFFDEAKIWEVYKNDLENAKIIMSDLLHIIKVMALLVQPFIPNASTKIINMLNLNDIRQEIGYDNFANILNLQFKFKLVAEVNLLFTKLDKEIVLQEKL
jgi:methionyl-tRNA synthetase